jgi:FAD/FMN-containing dehydrogenase
MILRRVSPPSTVNPERLAELRAGVLGPVLESGDPGYDEVRLAWNGMYDHRRPALIVQCMGVADVQAALAFARANDLVVAVRGGGHSISGASTIEGGLLIDLRLMRGVRVDPERQVAFAGPGTLFKELDRETQVHGLATTGGMISHTGISGLTLNGGVGRFMRKAGLSCDNVLSFDVVLADGTFVHADEKSHPDLYYALRGGGGDFGVVTQFEYQLHPLGPMLYGGYIGWPIDQAKEVFAAFREEQIDNAPDELQQEWIFTLGPEFEILPPHLVGQPILHLTVTWMDNDIEEGKRQIAPFLEKVPPAYQFVDVLPYTLLQAASDPISPHGRRSYTYAGYLSEISDELIGVATEFVEEAIGWSWPVVEVYQMGGAVSRVPKDATPCSEFRDAGWYYVHGTNWWDPTIDERGIDWTKRLEAAMTPFRLPGRYINFVSEDDLAGQRESLGEETFERLQEIKAKYDPNGVFSRNPNKRTAPVPAGV